MIKINKPKQNSTSLFIFSYLLCYNTREFNTIIFWREQTIMNENILTNIQNKQEQKYFLIYTYGCP